MPKIAITLLELYWHCMALLSIYIYMKLYILFVFFLLRCVVISQGQGFMAVNESECRTRGQGLLYGGTPLKRIAQGPNISSFIARCP